MLIFYADLGYFYGLESFLELSLYGWIMKTQV